MAYSFNGSSQYLNRTSAVVTVEPVTMACWFYSDVTGTESLMMISDEDANPAVYWWLNKWSDDILYASANDGSGGFGEAAAGAVASKGVWQHGCAIFASDTDRRVFINGGDKGTNATSSSPANLTRTVLAAAEVTSAVGNYFQGEIAEVGIWNIALTDEEVTILAAGYSPLFVRPQNLVAYWPLVRRLIDPVGGYGLTNNGTATVAAHSRIICPKPLNIFKPYVISGLTFTAKQDVLVGF